jgi:eukaryotic-like serine/threonine-protein kinase
MSAGANREEDLFDAARRLEDPTQRKAFLDFSCAGDSTLRTRIETLLEAHGEADRFFEQGAAAVAVSATPIQLGRSTRFPMGQPPADVPAEESIGARIGRYKVVQKIGEGGCGVVYLAEQEEPVRRHVALKIIRVGMETRSVIARFEAERQALAMMDHPNIARVFDAGATESGSPFFVMEHVRGMKITEYCDQNRLPVRQRLDLFVQVCHAIQHAHQKGIIHGDIKPSNIMVALHDGVPVPKVIDFGISKATEARFTERIPFTAYAQLIGTPAYMSPEQVEMGGMDVDTRSDIYSLGVLLFEMLTGRTPFDGRKLLESGLDEMRRIMRELHPVAPSASLHALEPAEILKAATARGTIPARLTSMLRGDLDCIVLKTLEKDRRRRYETANGLAMDVQRYMGDEPVTAHHSSWVYRLRKLVRRNRGVFVGVGAVATALVIGTGVSTWLLLKEHEARQRAVAAEQQQARLRHEAETREKIIQAALLVNKERFEEADSLLSGIALAESTVEGAAVFRSVGHWYALQNRWRQAADRFGVLLTIDQLDGLDVFTLDYLRCGPALVESADTAGYERFRLEAISRFSAAPCVFADRIVKISLLLPANDRLIGAMGPLAEMTVKTRDEAEAAGDHFRAAWHSVSLALYEYRRGNYAAAAGWCRRCLDYRETNAPRTATARAILALSLQQLGRPEEARAELALAREAVEAKFRDGADLGNPIQGFWFDWAFARILVREAAALIEGPRLSR